MTGPARTLAGQCLCGAVQIELADPAPHVEICQCDMCRRWGGSFFAGQSGGEALISGEMAVGLYRSSNWAERAFCMRCGSHLWFRFLPTGHRSFLAGLFESARDATIEKEIFVDESAHWTRLPGDHQRQTAAEVIAEAKAAGFTFD